MKLPNPFTASCLSLILCLSLNSCHFGDINQKKRPHNTGSNPEWTQKKRNPEFQRGSNQARSVAHEQGKRQGFDQGMRDLKQFKRFDQKRMESRLQFAQKMNRDNRITPMIHSPDFQDGFSQGYQEFYAQGYEEGYRLALSGKVPKGNRQKYIKADDRPELFLDDPVLLR